MYQRVRDINVTLGKCSHQPRQTTEKTSWKKRSIFWDLPYWLDLDVRHGIDVMHVEKNVCDSLLGTLLDIKGKTKDGKKARDDLKELRI